MFGNCFHLWGVLINGFVRKKPLIKICPFSSLTFYDSFRAIRKFKRFLCYKAWLFRIISFENTKRTPLGFLDGILNFFKTMKKTFRLNCSKFLFRSMLETVLRIAYAKKVADIGFSSLRKEQKAYCKRARAAVFSRFVLDKVCYTRGKYLFRLLLLLFRFQFSRYWVM